VVSGIISANGCVGNANILITIYPNILNVSFKTFTFTNTWLQHLILAILN